MTVKWYLYPLLFLLAAACTRHDRANELAACQLLSKSGDSLARCLILTYSWRADSATAARGAWQWQLDSLRLLHDSQAAIVVAAADTRVIAGLHRQVDSLWGELAWQLERNLRVQGYEPASIQMFLQRIRRHRYEPNAIEVITQTSPAFVNLIESRYDTLPGCAREVATVMETMVGTRGELVRAQAIICDHP